MTAFAPPAGLSFADSNGDGVLTIADAGAWLGDAFFVPGDWAIWAIGAYAAPLAQFLELDASAYGGVLAGFLSALAWCASFVAAGIGYRAVRDADEALTAAIIRAFQEARRLWRVAVRRMKLRHYETAPRQRVAPVEIGEETALSAEELRALRLHAALEPGYSLASSELARELAVRRDQVAELCNRLVRLKLLAPTLRASEGETAYALTAAGRALLVFRQLG